MPVVSNTVLDPSSAPVRVVVTVRLIAGETGYEPGYVDGGVIEGTVRTTSGDDGAWSVTLASNADITPANSYYEVLEQPPGRVAAYQHFISVPDGAGPYEVPDILVDEPESPDVLAIAITQKGAANGVATLDGTSQVPLSQLGNAPGGGGTAATTVVSETSYGQAAVVGVATTFARGDHSHGSPALGATGTTAAAGNHAHAGVYDPAGSAAAAQAASQPLDADLTAIAALAPTDGDTILRVAGAWLNRTMAQLKTALGLVKADVGLSNVDNTSDASKPISTATQTALDAKATKLVVRNLRVEEATNLTFPNTSGSWQFLTGLAVTVPAVVGDYVELTWAFMWDTTGNNFLDWHINVSNAIVLAMSSDTATPKTEGAPWLYPGADAFDKSPGPWGIVVTAPMLSAGNLTCQLAAKAVGSGTIFRSTDYPFTAKLKNHGPCDVA